MKSSTRDDEDLRPSHDDVDERDVSRVPQGRAADHAVDLTISSDITADFAIGPAELHAFETYFGDLLDMVLSGSKSAPPTMPRHKRVP